MLVYVAAEHLLPCTANAALRQRADGPALRCLGGAERGGRDRLRRLDRRGGELAPAEWLGLLLDREIAEGHGRRLKARLRFAKLRHPASVEDIDWRTSRGLDRALFQRLA